MHPYSAIHTRLLRNFRLVLASGSPRRKQLLEGLDIPFEVWDTVHTDESYPEQMDIKEIPLYLANKKAMPFLNSLPSDVVLVTSDTVVVHRNSILGKPSDRDQAAEMLNRLSGSTHSVITGVALHAANGRTDFTSVTEVTFRQLQPHEIDYYIDTYNPTDKAGAYGIQEWIGLVGVERIQGSFYNVMGLPVQQLYTELTDFIGTISGNKLPVR